jgi:LL-diaminopimelate aminotransferase
MGIVYSIGSNGNFAAMFRKPRRCHSNDGTGLPVFGTHSLYLLADIIYLPIHAKNNYLPVLDDIPKYIFQRTKAVVINYPNNPTGACAAKEFVKN